MTREEAIKILQHKIETMNEGAICCNYGIDKNAFDMAVKALEQELKFETVCRALVSIADKEGSDYGYTEACDIADKYLESEDKGCR